MSDRFLQIKKLSGFLSYNPVIWFSSSGKLLLLSIALVLTQWAQNLVCAPLALSRKETTWVQKLKLLIQCFGTRSSD